MKAYRFLAEARNEFDEQVRYFDEQAVGLGDRFIQDLEAAVLVVRGILRVERRFRRMFVSGYCARSLSTFTTSILQTKSSSLRSQRIDDGPAIGEFEPRT